ncbi:MAG TPA: serine hydrolase domain-containing protein [Candidatus Baltobacteraceae bacterium]|nr:serine hydrolase domain-containing protein [Candidatus Baltobacteraceae bacterium]
MLERLRCGGGSAAHDGGTARARSGTRRSTLLGVSIAVGTVKGVKVALAYGDADSTHKTPMTPQTHIRFASVSKAITSAAVLMLDQAGAISIDDPVAKYVPQYVQQPVAPPSPGATPTPSGSPRPIEIKDLMSMTSGLPGRAGGDPVLHGDGPITSAQFFAKINQLKLWGYPGTRWDYSNESYYLLAQLVQNVSGMSFADFLQRKIFQPAGMKDSYSDVGAPDPSLALGYVHFAQSDPFMECPAPDWSGEVGLGGVISTPSDIVRFDIAVMNGTLLDAQHRKAFLAPAWDFGNGYGYAYGWFTLPNGLVVHEGDFSTTQTINAIFPDGTFVVSAANGATLAPFFDRRYYVNQLQNAYGTTPFPLGTRVDAGPPPGISSFTTCEQLDHMLFDSDS